MNAGIYKKLPVGFYIISLIVILVSCLSYLVSPELLIYNLHYIVYYILCISAYVFFREKNMSIESAINGINQFYVIYLFVCIVMWLFELKLGAYNLGEKFTLEFFNINKSVLLGADGSPASIDSFSALIFILNLFFSVNRRKNMMLGISLIAVVLTLRLTPMVAMTVSLLAYVAIKNRITWLSVVLVMNSVFIVFLYMSSIIMQDIASIQNQD